jgi:hypothetical protein
MSEWTRDEALGVEWMQDGRYVLIRPIGKETPLVMSTDLPETARRFVASGERVA